MITADNDRFLRQVIPDDGSVAAKIDLQHQKPSIIDKLIKQRLVDAELDLSKTNLNELDLSGVSLRFVNLQLAKLQKANIRQSLFK